MKISIVMPVYNNEYTLKESIDSVLNQTLNDIELICIDMGSQDNSLKILNEFSEEYDYIKVLSEKGQSIANARNLGINKALGKYITFLEVGDVFLESNVLEELYETAVNNNANMVSGNVKLDVDDNENLPFDNLNQFSDFGEILPEEYGIPLYFNKNIFKREFIVNKNINFPDLLKGSENVFLVRVLLNIDKIFTVPMEICKKNTFNNFNTYREYRDYMIHYKMLFDNLHDSKFEKFRHLIRYDMLGFISKVGVDGGKDILNAAREIFDDKQDILRGFEDNFYFIHESDEELQCLINFRSNPEKPRISVLIPVYNASDFLKDSIGGLINQTFKDFELICVNDGSKDNSLEILNEFSRIDSRVKVIDKENGGCGSARNRALKESKGDYVYFFDPDDELESNTLEVVYKNAIYNDSDMTIFKANIIENNQISDTLTFFNLNKILKNRNFDKFSFDYHDVKINVLNGPFAPWSKLYKKEFLDKYNDFLFDEGVAFDDVPFHVKSMLRAKRISFVNEYLYHYRCDNVNSVNNTSSNGFDIFRIFDIVENFLKNEGCFEDFESEFFKFVIDDTLLYIISTNSEKYFKMAKDKFSKIDEKFVPKNNSKFDLVISTDDYDEFKLKFIELEYFEENKKLSLKLNKLEKEITSLKKKNKKLKKENNKLKKQNKDSYNSKFNKIFNKVKNKL